MTSATIAELQRSGVFILPHEAVAIAQELIQNPTTEPPEPPFGPPTPENVRIDADGSVTCCACESTPAVSEVAIFLTALLPDGTPRVPGGLRYAIARALLDVDAPPFDSIDELAGTLTRFERGERITVLRELFDRFAASGAVVRADAPMVRTDTVVVFRAAVDRRQLMPSATDLRRELRFADAQLYAQRATDHAAVNAGSARRRGGVVALGIAAGLALIASGELMHLRDSSAGAPSTAAAAAAPKPGLPPSPPGVSRTAAPPASVPATPVSSVEIQRRTPPPSAAARRTVKTARAESASEDHIRGGSEQPGALVAALDVHRRPVFSPAFASNGSAVFFHSGRTSDRTSALLAVNTGGDDLRVTTIVDDGAKNFHVQPSPDGRQIAFDSDRDGERGVYIASSDGTNVRRVSGTGYAAVPTWSPDSSRIAYVRAEADNPKVWNLWLLSNDSGETRRLTNYRYGQPWAASWFPDGRRIAYTHEDRLLILDLASGAARAFPSPVKGRLLRTAAVSPDGEHVIFQVYRNGAWLLKVSDGSMHCVLTDPSAEEFAWAPDGRRVAFHSRRDGEWGIFVMAP